ncbi:MAG: sodium/solute symporter [Calditrichaceae bacterium]|nr:sodium:solute symporter [Calditrichia bacterium]NUQ41588.1 sodium/solute symporter [Calditrichaceae bacterium]
MLVGNISDIDFGVILAYFAVTVGLGIWASRRRGDSSANYFLAGRNVGWIAIGASLFATNISSEHFIGLAGSGAARGLAVGNFEWMATIFIMMLGWIFVPIYLHSGIFTIPEFLEKRFNKASRIYLTTVSIIAYILTKISVTLFAGSLLLQELLGWDMYTSTIIMVVLTGIYTIMGGLGAVIYTSLIQTVILIGGAITLTVIGLNEVGGFTGLQERLPADYFSMFKPVSDPDFPWTGMVFGAPILGIWYWCTDQYIVQRVLSARNINHARSGTILAGFLKILPVFILVLPGLIAAALYPEVSGDEAYPILVTSFVLPAGLKGVIIASLLAALMSSLASCFNSTSTLFTMDFYKLFNPSASERRLVLMGRLATTLMVITAILWVPLTRLISSQIYIYMQSVQAYISPPIAAVFLLGIFWKRLNGRGAIWALAGGGIIGAVRLVSELFYNAGQLHSVLLIGLVKINFLHFAVYLFLVSSGIFVLVSFLSELPRPAQVYGLTFSTANGSQTSLVGMAGEKYAAWNRMNVAFSVLLMVILGGLWGMFF